MYYVVTLVWHCHSPEPWHSPLTEMLAWGSCQGWVMLKCTKETSKVIQPGDVWKKYWCGPSSNRCAAGCGDST